MNFVIVMKIVKLKKYNILYFYHLFLFQIITCGQCRKEIKLPIDKQKPSSVMQSFTEEKSLSLQTPKSGKKKKKNRDKSAGLNLSFKNSSGNVKKSQSLENSMSVENTISVKNSTFVENPMSVHVEKSASLNKSLAIKNGTQVLENPKLQSHQNTTKSLLNEYKKKNKKIDLLLLKKENERKLIDSRKNKQQAQGKMKKISKMLNTSNNSKGKKGPSGSLRMFLQSMQ